MVHVEDTYGQDNGLAAPSQGDGILELLQKFGQGFFASASRATGGGDSDRRKYLEEQLRRAVEQEEYERSQDVLRNERSDRAEQRTVRKDAEAKTEKQRKEQRASNERLIDSFLAPFKASMNQGSRRTFGQDASLKRWEETNRTVGNLQTARQSLEHAASVGDQYIDKQRHAELSQMLDADPKAAPDILDELNSLRGTYQGRKRDQDQTARQLEQLKQRADDAIENGRYTRAEANLMLADVESGVRTASDALNEIQKAIEPGGLTVRIPGLPSDTEIPVYAVSEDGGDINQSPEAVDFWLMVSAQLVRDVRGDPSKVEEAFEGQFAQEQVAYEKEVVAIARKLAHLYGGWDES